MRPIRRIVIHCSATPEGAHYTAADIRRWHKARGWSDIGYHAVVLLDGTVEPGRPLGLPGAHVAGHNQDSLGICYIGGVADDGRQSPRDTRTLPQARALLAQVREWMDAYDVPADRVVGHRELDPRKACPSFDVADLRAELLSATPDPVDPYAKLAQYLRDALAGAPTVDARGTDAARAALHLQRALGVTSDAIVGPNTWAAVARYLADEARADVNLEDLDD
jgi:N-acetylmuramoyl-L-alanine amidase